MRLEDRLEIAAKIFAGAAIVCGVVAVGCFALAGLLYMLGY